MGDTTTKNHKTEVTKMTDNPNFPPLTPLQKRHKRNLIDRFFEFWGHISFTRGYRQPSSCKEDVAEYLKHAAEAVVRIRDVFISGDVSPPFRIPEGDAMEFLWREQGHKLDPAEFTKKIIYATLQNDPELHRTEIDKQTLDNFITQFLAWKQANKKAAHEKLQKLVASLHAAASRCEAVASEIESSILPPVALLGPENCRARDLSTHLKFLMQDIDAFLIHIERQKALHDSDIFDLAAINKAHEQKQSYNEAVAIEASDAAAIAAADQQSSMQESEQSTPTSAVNETPAAALDSQPEIKSSEAEMEVDKKQTENKETENEMTTGSPTPAASETPTTTPEASAPTAEVPESLPKTPVATTVEQTNPTAPDASQPSHIETEIPPPKDASMSDSPTDVPPRAETPSTAFMLEVKKVASNVDTLKPQIQQLRENSDLLNLSELSRNPLEGVKQVEKLQKKSLEYSEYLMRSLLALDKLESTEKTRPIRREQVINIQRMMDEMDALSIKLKELRSQLEKEVASIQEEENKKRVAQQDSKDSPAPPPVPSQALSTKLRWAEMRLKPKLNVREERNAYLIFSSIPGLKKEDISLSLSENEATLVVEGVRLPTEEELAQMERLLEMHKARYRGLSKEAALMHLGAGRYGKFSEKFSLPEDADVRGITASYENNVLKVVIPKIVRRTNQNPWFHPVNPGFTEPNLLGGLFGDRDMWW